MKIEIADVLDCSACGMSHKGAHLITVVGVVFYFCPVTENRVPVRIEPEKAPA